MGFLKYFDGAINRTVGTENPLPGQMYIKNGAGEIVPLTLDANGNLPFGALDYTKDAVSIRKSSAPSVAPVSLQAAAANTTVSGIDSTGYNAIAIYTNVTAYSAAIGLFIQTAIDGTNYGQHYDTATASTISLSATGQGCRVFKNIPDLMQIAVSSADWATNRINVKYQLLNV